jgi:hypothetical protein
VHQKVVASLGRLRILQTSSGLDRVITPLPRYSERCWLEAEGEGNLAWAKCHSPLSVFRRLWENLGLDKQVAQLAKDSRVEFPVDEATFAMAKHGYGERNPKG